MFQTAEFKDQLKSVIAKGAAGNSLIKYDGSIVDHLQGLATGNEAALMELEKKKPADERRGVQEALDSASELVEEAAQYCAEEGRNVLRLPDIQKAVQTLEGQAWPFTRSED